MYCYEIQTSMSVRIDPEIEGSTIDSIIGCTNGVKKWSVIHLGEKHIRLKIYSRKMLGDDVLIYLEEDLAENFGYDEEKMFQNVKVSEE
ncbi:MAG: hypothetical protein ABIA78_03620 [archaeon]